MSGWIKLHRKFDKWEWRDKPDMVSLFLHILMEANYEERKWHGITIKRGQCVFGRKKWSIALGISERSLRTCLERLKSTNELTIETTNQFSILTVVNYQQYQDEFIETTSKTTSRLVNDRPATDQRPTTPKEYKKERSKEYNSRFLEIWEIYPKKDGKAKAQASYIKSLKEVDHETLIAGVKRYIEKNRGKDATYILHLSTWFNGKRWEDEGTLQPEVAWNMKPQNRMPSPAGG